MKRDVYCERGRENAPVNKVSIKQREKKGGKKKERRISVTSPTDNPRNRNLAKRFLLQNQLARFQSSVARTFASSRRKNDIAGQCLSTHIVLDARLVSSCLSWPSRARPRLSLLSASVGLREKTLLSVNPGDTPILPVQSFYFLYRCVIIPFAD